nr:NACHT domain-containing protein [Streptomyces sp. SID13726]
MVRKLFVQEGPGAGLVGRPVRLSALVSFKGEKRALGEKELHKLARELVERSASTAEPEAVADALARTLHALGDLDLDDMQAVRLGHRALADQLYTQAGGPGLVRHLSQEATDLYTDLLNSACLHILHFFTRRSTFVARTLVEQSRRLDELIGLADLLLTRLTSRTGEDTAFEGQYTRYIAARHSRLTIYGIDLTECREWPLDTAYLSLEAAPDIRPDDILGDRRPPSAPRPVEQALAGHDRVLLRGVAGSGKTTLVQWLAVTTARQEQLTGRLAHLMGRVPFVLPLRTLTRGGAALPVPGDFLTAVSCPLAGSQPPGWADRVLAAGRGLLLIDGVDEVPEPERARTSRWLTDLLAAFPDNLWLVTSRPSAVREEWLGGEDFTELSLSPMSRADIAVFVHRWHEATGAGGATAEALLSSVRTQQDMARLATNPLMCALICALHRERRGFLPRGRKALYDAALAMLLERRDRERDLTVELDEESQIELLQRLAYWLIRNGRAEMEHADAVHQVERLLPSMPYVAAQGTATEILRHLLVRSGLLREPVVGAVDFVHRTFQDYLGARAIVEERDFDVLVAHAHLDQWEDVVRMAVAHARPDERARLLTGLVERGDREQEHAARLHLLAMACLEHAAKLDPEVRGDVEARAGELIPPRDTREAADLANIGPFVLELLPGPNDVGDEVAATHTVYTAIVVGGDAALSFLTRYRDHDSLMVRNRLAYHWEQFDTEAYGNEIIRPLLDRPGTSVVVRSQEELSALSGMGCYDTVELSGEFTAEQITAALDERLLTSLELRHTALTDLTFLCRYRRLRQLSLSDCLDLMSLESLRGLPLEELALSDVPALALSTQWGVLATLPNLVALDLEDVDLNVLGDSGVSLAGVESLTVEAYGKSVDLGAIATIFPGLTWLTVGFARELDVAPLAALPRLRHLSTSHSCFLRNTHELPATVRLNSPYPM